MHQSQRHEFISPEYLKMKSRFWLLQKWWCFLV